MLATWPFTNASSSMSSEAFLAILVMTYFLQLGSTKLWTGSDFDLLELYAGRARLTRIARACGYSALATDKVYDKDPECKSSLQLNNAAGFTLPVLHEVICNKLPRKLHS